MRNLLIGFGLFFLLNSTLEYASYNDNERVWRTAARGQAFLKGSYLILPLTGRCTEKGGTNGHGWKIKSWADYFHCDRFQRWINREGAF
jgi:hypothetical protein